MTGVNTLFAALLNYKPFREYENFNFKCVFSGGMAL